MNRFRSFLSCRDAIRKLFLPQPNIGGRMHFRVKLCVSMLAITLLFGLAGVPAGAQDKQHVVSLSDLNKDAPRPAQTLQSNEEAVRTLLSSPQAPTTLKPPNLHYHNAS